jgi:hypothetical protein
MTGQDGLSGVEPFDREQVAGSTQAIDMARGHGLVPLGFAERQDATRSSGVFGSQNRHVDFDLRPVRRIGARRRRHLSRQVAEDVGVDACRPGAAEGLEVGADHL